MNKHTKIYEHDGKPCKDCGRLFHYPTPYLIKSYKKSEKNRKEGKVSPIFSTVDEMHKWMDDDHAKYQNGDCVCGKKHS